MKVTVIDSLSGRPRTMDRRYADILTRLGRARYMTRDMKAEEGAQSVKPAAARRARKTAAKRARKTSRQTK